MMLFIYKDAASKCRTEVLEWGGGRELGRQELGKGHGTTAGEMVLKVLYGKGAQCTPGAVLHSSCQGTLLEPMDRVILSALHLPLRHNTQH